MGSGIVSVAALVENLRLQAIGCRHLGSPFYAELVELMADDVEAGGPVWTLLGAHAGESFGAAYPIRLLGGVHRMVLSGAAPALAAHFPTTGGDGDVVGMWPEYRDLLASQPAVVLDTLQRPPQTNEVGRAASLAGGLAVVAQCTDLPIRLLEIGTSAGLNLRLDRYCFEQDGIGWGDPASTVRFSQLWAPACPPFDARTVIASRRGCDRDPIDVTADDATLALLSYVWPGQDARFRTLHDALEIAKTVPVSIDRADAVEWLPHQLTERRAGQATVVMHSIFWQYLAAEAQDAIVATFADAGARGTADAPLAWLRLEPSERGTETELRLTRWPGGDEVVLATAGFHAGPVEWRA